MDLGCIIDQYKTWCAYLPTVKPFYAVKCNDDIAMLKTLAVLGAGFDCASKVSQTVERLLCLPHAICSTIERDKNSFEPWCLN